MKCRIFNSLSLSLVPAPNCISAVSSNGDIAVNWEYIHTGGLQLTAVQVEYSFQSLLVEVTRPAGDTGVNDRSLVVPELLTGQVYTFKVTATNSEGSASSECPPVDHRIGLYQSLLKPVHQVCMSYCHGLCNNICVMFSLHTHTHTHILTGVPQAPLPFTVTETGQEGGVSMMLVTNSAGVGASPHSFQFDVSYTIPGRFPLVAEFPIETYQSGESATVTIEGLDVGQLYIFSARARNQFGSSDYTQGPIIRITGVCVCVCVCKRILFSRIQSVCNLL